MKKKCTKCKRILPYSEFYKAKSAKDGLDYRCKKCISKYQKKRNVDLKREAMIAFGSQCAYIGKNGIQCSKNVDDNLDELELSHPNNDGDAYRALICNGQCGSPFYKALKDRTWDTNGFVVEVRCRTHHRRLDKSGKYGNRSSSYKGGKHNNPAWLKRKYETMTLQEIADLCGVSLSTVYNRMIEFGHPRRKQNQRP